VQKIRDFKVDFFFNFLGHSPRLLMGRGYGRPPQTLPLVAPALRASRISLGTFSSSICPTWKIKLTFECTAWFLPCDALRCTVFGIVILSVCLSVCPSVTLVDCVHMVRPTIMISSPFGSPIILIYGDITFIPKFEGGHPERERWMRVGWVRIGDFRPISRRISETVRDTTKVTINH